jgi:adenylate kinase family enzyme
MTEISQALAARMAAAIRAIYDGGPRTTAQAKAWQEIDCILSQLPKPVDPDVLECREILATIAEENDWPNNARLWRSGSWDNQSEMQLCLVSLKRGRELAAESVK